MTWQNILKLSTEEAIEDAKRFGDEEDLEGEGRKKTRLLKELRQHQKQFQRKRRHDLDTALRMRAAGRGYTHLTADELTEWFNLMDSNKERQKTSLKFIGDALNNDKLDRAEMALLAYKRKNKMHLKNVSKYRRPRRRN